MSNYQPGQALTYLSSSQILQAFWHVHINIHLTRTDNHLHNGAFYSADTQTLMPFLSSRKRMKFQ